MRESGTVTVNGAKLYYEMRGEGRPLALVAPGIADSRLWDAQMDAVSRRYTVIRYDHRGYGKSDLPRGPFVGHEDLHGLLRALGVGPTHVLGISMGGTFAIDCALAHPEAVSALVLVGSWLSGFRVEASEAEKARWGEFNAAVEAGELERANELEVDLKLAGIFRPADAVDPAARRRLLAIHRDHFARLGEWEGVEWVSLEPPAVGRLGEIRVPTLVLDGDRDVPAVGMIAAKLAAEIPGARRMPLRDAAHVPCLEHPEEFNRVVLDFLNEL